MTNKDFYNPGLLKEKVLASVEGGDADTHILKMDFGAPSPGDLHLLKLGDFARQNPTQPGGYYPGRVVCTGSTDSSLSMKLMNLSDLSKGSIGSFHRFEDSVDFRLGLFYFHYTPKGTDPFNDSLKGFNKNASKACKKISFLK